MRRRRVEVCNRATDGLVEHVVGRGDSGGARGRGAERPARLTESGKERSRGTADVLAGGEAKRDEHGPALVRREADGEFGPMRREGGRRGLEAQTGLATAPVQTGIGEKDAIGSEHGIVQTPATLALGTANFEDIGEVGGKVDCQAERARPDIEVRQRQPLARLGFPEEARAADVQEVLKDRTTTVGVCDLGVGEVADQDGVVIANRRGSSTSGRRPSIVRPSCDT